MAWAGTGLRHIMPLSQQTYTIYKVTSWSNWNACNWNTPYMSIEPITMSLYLKWRKTTPHYRLHDYMTAYMLWSKCNDTLYKCLNAHCNASVMSTASEWSSNKSRQRCQRLLQYIWHASKRKHKRSTPTSSLRDSYECLLLNYGILHLAT